MENAAVVEKVNISYPNFHCIKNLSFTMKKGEIYSILGPNGSGKTTILRCLSTLIYPQSGSVTVLGFPLQRKSQEIRRRIGVMFEGGIELFYRLTAEDTMEYYAALKLISKSETTKTTRELLETVGLWEIRTKKVYQMSRGMKQKLHLAVALLSKPELLILDEPLLGLDVDTQNFFIDYIREYVNEKNTVLIAAHSLHILEKISHNLLILKDGEKLVEGSLKMLMERIKWRYKVSIEFANRIPYHEFDALEDATVHADPVNKKITVYVKTLDETVFEEILKIKENVRDIDIRPVTLEEAYINILGGTK